MYQALVSFNHWTFIAQICNLLLQMFLFKKFLFEPVKKIIAQRQAEVGQLYSDAEEAKQSAEHDKAEYSEKLLAANEEAASIVRTATERAGRQGDEIVQEAQHKAQAMLKKADEDIALERAKAMNEIKNDISQMALDIAEKVVEKEIRAEDHKALIEDFIASVGEDA
ncbi:MAG: F0F1 ATP synthase subunit B [Clostridia bacterium]|nr:F0F1 ATP synthase subunit B [Clostridia bacterium]MBQ9924999.1 F0F1 ATP synthase subunit B [Clostridia bacterium]MBQ9966677.1 F0F1 ATP synthase subunit B [Clostridia bacterium]